MAREQRRRFRSACLLVGPSLVLACIWISDLLRWPVTIPRLDDGMLLQ